MTQPPLPHPLPLPTPELVRAGIDAFSEQGKVTEPAIRRLIQAFPLNTEVSDVLLKAITINQIYSTGIIAVQAAAEIIWAANIDADLLAGEPGVVKRIERLRFTSAQGQEIDRSMYSFATKYCALHQPAHFPIYDGLISDMLLKYNKQEKFSDFNWDALRDYPKFRSVILSFRTHFGLEAFSLREIDQFLWTLGKGLLPLPASPAQE